MGAAGTSAALEVCPAASTSACLAKAASVSPRAAAAVRTASPMPRKSMLTRSRDALAISMPARRDAAWQPFAGGQPILHSISFKSLHFNLQEFSDRRAKGSDRQTPAANAS